MIICWFSGGRDSAFACFLAKRTADIKHEPFKLVHINTTIYIPETHEYVYKYAEWLGVELIELKPRHSFKELARKYPYWPVLKPDRYRWCYYHLKWQVVLDFLRNNRDAYNALHVFGIRHEESLFRLRSIQYESVFSTKCYAKDTCIRAWFPLLNVNSTMLEKLIEKYAIPRNPVWRKIGISGDCLCLAGTPYSRLVKIAVHYPDAMRELLEIDDLIQSNRSRSNQPSYPAPLIKRKLTLRHWYESFIKQSKLTDFMNEEYTGALCEGSCLLPGKKV